MPKQYKYRQDVTIHGRRYTVRADSKSQLAEKVAKKIKQVEEGLVDKHMLFSKWADVCFEKYKKNVTEETRHNQRRRVQIHVEPILGNMRLKDIKPLHCQDVLNGLEGKSADLIQKTNQLMNWIFEKAVQNHLLLRNPAEHLDLPQGTKKSRRGLTAVEREHILAVAEQNPRYVFFLMMLFCGCRPQEVARLQGKDVKQIDGENILHIEGTKSAAAVRDVPIPDYLFQRLPQVSPFEYLFTNQVSKRMSRNDISHLWKHMKRDLHLSMGGLLYRNQTVVKINELKDATNDNLQPGTLVADDLVPYCLRHEYCTNLQRMGIDLKTAQVLMGHANISITADIYQHLDNQAVIHAAKLIKAAE